MKLLPWDAAPHCWTSLVDTETAARYAAYRRDLFVGQRPALVIVDAYDQVLGQDTVTAGIDGVALTTKGVVDRISDILRLFRSAGLPVIHATDVRALGPALGDPLSATNRPAAADDAAPYRFVPRLAPVDGETVLHKMRASAYYGTPLNAVLTSAQHDSVVIAGQTTSGCVRASVVDAFSAGFHVAVVEDACFDRFFLSHAVNLFDMHHKYADVMTGDRIVELLS